ncbi:MAG: GTPase HflX [Candidatus Omnitrophica bacterium]|nr:GTPase HflX [Candidatus Omnitrophota bacterium]
MYRALLITVDFRKREDWTAEERSMELSELTGSAGAKIIKTMIVNRHAPCPSHFIGSGKAEEVAAICAAEKINLVIFNNDLTGTQQKNLEESIGVKVIDRTQLILDIFARRARSNEGKLQVELAQLMYMMPRLTDKGTELSRLGGGIGTRGPGEQKLEVDRRRIRDRIARLKKELESLGSRRGMMRKRRDKFRIPSVAIVGYTNTGKSTLLNAITGSSVAVRDKLFATLDPTIRKLTMPNRREILFIDTVGFLKELPHHLIEAFKATLEEAVEADLLLHLIDASHPKAKEQAEAVYKVLGGIGALDKPIITVLNKIDRVSPEEVVRLKDLLGAAVAISALNKEGLGGLLEKITRSIPIFT